jgi:hypothetical protein
MRRRAVALPLLLGAVLGSLLVSVGAPPATAAVEPNTSWSMASDSGDYILAGQPYAYDASSGMILQGTSTGITGSVDGWHLTVEPADGDVLEAGRTYAGATRWPFNEAGEPALDLDGHGRGCNTLKGTFSVQELTFDLSGDLASAVLTFEQHCEGQAPAAYGSIAWHSSMAAPALPATIPAPPVPPTLTLKVAGRKVDYGQKTTVQVQLSGDAPNHEVAVYARTTDGQEQLLAKSAVDAGGRLDVPATLTETTTFVARFQGGSGFPAREASETLTVGAKLRTGLLEKVPKRGKYHLYRPSQDATVAGLLAPNHAGDCIKFRLQLQVRGTWGYDLVTKCLRLNKDSVTAVRLPGDPRLAGVPIRVHAEWKGDARNTRATGKWVFLKFGAR